MKQSDPLIKYAGLNERSYHHSWFCSIYYKHETKTHVTNSPSTFYIIIIFKSESIMKELLRKNNGLSITLTPSGNDDMIFISQYMEHNTKTESIHTYLLPVHKTNDCIWE